MDRTTNFLAVDIHFGQSHLAVCKLDWFNICECKIFFTGSFLVIGGQLHNSKDLALKPQQFSITATGVYGHFSVCI